MILDQVEDSVEIPIPHLIDVLLVNRLDLAFLRYNWAGDGEMVWDWELSTFLFALVIGVLGVA